MSPEESSGLPVAPGLTLHGRSAYKDVWECQAKDYASAMQAVAGPASEQDLDVTGLECIGALEQTVGVRSTDAVLEIGCGIARVGKPLSSRCLHWFGADISPGMLAHARRRLQGCPNTTLVELATVGLQEFPTGSFDLVYCTVVFMHLFEWDRYRYVEEAFRVLRPGGRCYFDNLAFDSEQGWAVFMQGSHYVPDARPAHMSMCSSREELTVYLSRAGFLDVKIHPVYNGMIAATGLKAL